MKRAARADRPLSPPVRGSTTPPPPASDGARARGGAPLRRHVDRTDLAGLDRVTALLSTLNDPRASAMKVARDVAEIEVLVARVEDRFIQRKGGPLPRLVEQIALLGNRELERILLAFLEDIVTLHSEEANADPAAEVP